MRKAWPAAALASDTRGRLTHPRVGRRRRPRYWHVCQGPVSLTTVNGETGQCPSLTARTASVESASPRAQKVAVKSGWCSLSAQFVQQLMCAVQASEWLSHTETISSTGSPSGVVMSSRKRIRRPLLGSGVRSGLEKSQTAADGSAATVSHAHAPIAAAPSARRRGMRWRPAGRRPWKPSSRCGESGAMRASRITPTQHLMAVLRCAAEGVNSRQAGNCRRRALLSAGYSEGTRRTMTVAAWEGNRTSRTSDSALPCDPASVRSCPRRKKCRSLCSQEPAGPRTDKTASP